MKDIKVHIVTGHFPPDELAKVIVMDGDDGSVVAVPGDVHSGEGQGRVGVVGRHLLMYTETGSRYLWRTKLCNARNIQKKISDKKKLSFI